MKIVYITAGAAGMYCGSCLHDNTLARALMGLGHDVLLVPTYTPLHTDEEDVTQKQIFFGGINVFLQQKFSLFRHTPRFFDRLLDSFPLLRWVGRFAAKTRAEELGDLTLSMLRGEHGHQRKEVARLVRWLVKEARPDVINLSNVLLSGVVHEVKARLKVPILATLQGDDIFLDSLPASCRPQALALIRHHCREIDGFISTSGNYADFMSGYLGIPRERIDVVFPGLNLKGHGGRLPRTGNPLNIGYFARIAPEKGLHNLVEAYLRLRSQAGMPQVRLLVSGWLGEHHRPYLEQQRKRLADAGLERDFEYVASPDHGSKVAFLQRLDVLSVPTVYHEPKGLYVLEALANGVPVVQPRHGSFPELIEATGGGVLVEPNNSEDLAQGLRRLLEDSALRLELGRKGEAAVRQRFTADVMAQLTVDVYRKYL